MFLEKGVLKICSNYPKEQQCQSVQSNLIEITLRYEWTLVNLLPFFRKPFPRNTFGGLLLKRLILSKILSSINLQGFISTLQVLFQVDNFHVQTLVASSPSKSFITNKNIWSAACSIYTSIIIYGQNLWKYK